MDGHVVQSGDSLSQIAKLHGITMARLFELNPELIPHPNIIKIGEVVRIG